MGEGSIIICATHVQRKNKLTPKNQRELTFSAEGYKVNMI